MHLVGGIEQAHLRRSIAPFVVPRQWKEVTDLRYDGELDHQLTLLQWLLRHQEW
jgi:hypothetical protein